VGMTAVDVAVATTRGLGRISVVAMDRVAAMAAEEDTVGMVSMAETAMASRVETVGMEETEAAMEVDVVVEGGIKKPQEGCSSCTRLPRLD
jgi:hypothetical protein